MRNVICRFVGGGILDEFTEGQLGGALSVCRDGYEILNRWAKHDSGATIETLVIVAKSSIHRVVPVMSIRKAPTLHRSFAKIAKGKHGATRSRILKFVDQYGLLDGRIRAFERWAIDEAEKWAYSANHVQADDYWDWAYGPNDMQALVELWDLVRAADVDDLAQKKLARYVRRRDGKLQLHYGWTGEPLEENRGFFERVLRRPWLLGWEPGDDDFFVIGDERDQRYDALYAAHPQLRGPRPDVVAAARLFIYRCVTANLAGQCSPRLTMERAPALALVFEPANLRGAIWLHFAREMMGADAALQICANPGCGVQFRPRANKHYCSAACRVESHRAQRRAGASVSIGGMASG